MVNFRRLEGAVIGMNCLQQKEVLIESCFMGVEKVEEFYGAFL